MCWVIHHVQLKLHQIARKHQQWSLSMINMTHNSNYRWLGIVTLIFIFFGDNLFNFILSNISTNSFMSKFSDNKFCCICINTVVYSNFTFFSNKNLITELAFSAILFANSWIVINSGIVTSLIIFKLSHYRRFLNLLFSCSFTEAKLLWRSTSLSESARLKVSL